MIISSLWFLSRESKLLDFMPDCLASEKAPRRRVGAVVEKAIDNEFLSEV